MSIEIRVPTLGESVTEATVGKWFKQEGEAVKVDEPLVELETDKVTVEVPAPASGVLGNILVKSGSTVAVGSLLAALKDGAVNASATAFPSPAPKAASPPPQPKPRTCRCSDTGSGRQLRHAAPSARSPQGADRSRARTVRDPGFRSPRTDPERRRRQRDRGGSPTGVRITAARQGYNSKSRLECRGGAKIAGDDLHA